MLYLPTVNPLYEKIAATKIAIPDVLDKLGKEGFTGYMNHSAPGFESHCIFANGKLICTNSSEGERVRTGFEALVMLFDKVLGMGGVINVYRMTVDIAVCVNALAVGARLFDGDEVRQVDIKNVLARLKMQGFTGTVRFYTAECFAMIFYKEGAPIGFYRNGSAVIESSPEESRKVAALPGARIDVCISKPLDELLQHDLLQLVNLEKLWHAAQARQEALRSNTITAQKMASPPPDDARLADLAEDLAEVASAYLSRAGRELIVRLLRELGGHSLLADEVRRSHFLSQVKSEGLRIDGDARVDEMIDLMTSEISGRLTS